MIYLSSPAVVLGKEPSGEANLNLTFYTKNYGKVKVLARGGRKINAKLIPHLSVINLVNLELVLKVQFRLIGAEVSDFFPFLRREEEGLSLALNDLSFLSNLIVAPERDLKVWVLLSNYLRILDFLAGKKVDGSLLFVSSIAFKLNLARKTGYAFDSSEIEGSNFFSDSEKSALSLIASKNKFADLLRSFLNSPFAGKQLDFKAANRKLESYLKKVVPYEI